MPPPRRPFAGLNSPDVVSRVCLLALGGILFWTLASRLTVQPLPAEFQNAQKRLAEGKKSDAASRFRILIVEKPDDLELRMAVLQACARFGHWDLVVSFGEAALNQFKAASSEGRARLYAAVSQAYLEGRVGTDWRRNALERARTAYELDRYNPEMLNAYGYALAELNENLPFADVLLSEALTKSDAAPPTPESRLLRAQILDSYGWLRYRQKDYPGAVKALERALVTLPDVELPGSTLKVFHYHLGAACRMAGRPEDARLALRVALRYDPDYREALDELRRLGNSSPVAPH